MTRLPPIFGGISRQVFEGFSPEEVEQVTDVNVTTDLPGNLVETGPSPGAATFAFNCDIATPMRYEGDAVYAVDLFADILVRADGTSYEVCDLEELAEGARDGLVSPREANAAGHAISELTGLVERGRLVPWLAEVCPFGPSRAPAALPRRDVPLALVPAVRPGVRSTWG
ncbi:DUF402 domain-containing protein [Nonomuraea sp. NPDC050643]|uniref:DUF402 domain-containing protein n=1 Tax=Nonomuraea sp. NPDC050643 TaxID=3155660 RepID=UPI0033EDFAC2